ncbi:MAG TPA: glutathione S-transferase N-terminal domain-containing protein, partial [Steroidobacteraceae bacterium]|nr:glutathione S-transferase N-terminal domain-containing protein [Steroidobacteraceae bacterium]
MTDVILHHYDASPFTQRALRMLGIKGLAWRSVETPMMPPKDDLVALTGGYRGTPVLQIGADVYVDSQRIARELERRFPSPSLFPGGNTGLTYAMVKWSDAF